MLAAPVNGKISSGGVEHKTALDAPGNRKTSGGDVEHKTALNTPVNGQTSGRSVEYEIRTFSCNVGYRLRGSARRICQYTGEWSGSSPTCSGKRKVFYLFTLN